MPAPIELIRRLADGDCHSGEALARDLGLSRAAVWKALRKAAGRYGLALESVPGRGYRLGRPLELLDPDLIRGALSAAGLARLGGLEVHDQLDSTNTRLMAAAGGAAAGTVCLAEHQTAGRGRRGRTWVSSFAGNLCLSLLWHYPVGPAALGGVSLAAGAAVAGVLERLGVRDLVLKWPNDLLWRGRKLGGLLLEVTGEAQGPSRLVVGLGLNLHLAAADGQGIDQPWVDLEAVLGRDAPRRNRLAAALIETLLAMLDGYGESGLGPWLGEWARFDGLCGQPVRLVQGERVVLGDYAGIDPDGALRLTTAAGTMRVYAGEVSLRAAAPVPAGLGV